MILPLYFYLLEAIARNLGHQQRITILFSFLVTQMLIKVILILIAFYFVKRILMIDVEKIKPEKIKELIMKHKIVPDVIDMVPKHAIKVHWLHGIAARFGNKLVPEDLRLSPFLVTWPFKKGAMYTLLMTDPDVPSRQNHSLREWNHWIFGNMPGPLMLTGDTLAEYIGPDPLNGTGVHRYIFLIYKQPGNITFNEPILKEERNDSLRAHFSTRKFAKKYKLGEPVAVNFFVAEWKKNSSTGIDEYSYDAFRINDELVFKNPFGGINDDSEE